MMVLVMMIMILHDDGDDFDNIFRSGSIGHGLSLKCVRWLCQIFLTEKFKILLSEEEK